MQSIFFEVGFIVVLATILGGFVKYLRQPLVLAYIFTGVLVKILGFSHVGSPETLSFFSHLGIAFLLFIVGLELNPRELKEWLNKESIYEWSSYQDLIEKNRFEELLVIDIISEQFENKKEYDEFVKSSPAKLLE